MNNYYNFNFPAFNTEYGSDWDNFKTIIDDNVDYIMNKTFQLYWLFDPNYFTTKVAEKVSDSLSLSYETTTTLQTKKYNIRKFLTDSANKGLEATYLDIQESIVGIRGTLISGVYSGWKNNKTSVNNYNRWGSSGSTFAGALKWSKTAAQFSIYINVETTDSALLDLIEIEYRKNYVLPAFYTIYLVDNSFNYLRTV